MNTWICCAHVCVCVCVCLSCLILKFQHVSSTSKGSSMMFETAEHRDKNEDPFAALSEKGV